VTRFNLVISGVGGQGVLTLSRIIAQSAILMGYSVRVGETLGMSQRGGVVQSYVKFGSDVHSPLIEAGSADALISLDYVEALRASRYISSKTVVIVNERTIPPLSTVLGLELLPSLDEVKKFLERISSKACFLDAYELALKAGLAASVNVVLAGVFSALFKDIVNREAVVKSIQMIIPRRYIEPNLRAFELGYNFIESSKSSS